MYIENEQLNIQITAWQQHFSLLEEGFIDKQKAEAIMMHAVIDLNQKYQ
jgi:hypothetical protein